MARFLRTPRQKMSSFLQAPARGDSKIVAFQAFSGSESASALFEGEGRHSWCSSSRRNSRVTLPASQVVPLIITTWKHATVNQTTPRVLVV